MVEDVSTGGLMSFRHKFGEDIKANDEEKKNIQKGYEEYYARKQKERNMKIIIAVIVIIVLLVIGITAFLFS